MEICGLEINMGSVVALCFKKESRSEVTWMIGGSFSQEALLYSRTGLGNISLIDTERARSEQTTFALLLGMKYKHR